MGEKEGNSVDKPDKQKTGMVEKQKAGAENVQNTSAEKTVPQVIGWKSASGKYLGNFKLPLTATAPSAVAAGRAARPHPEKCRCRAGPLQPAFCRLERS